MSDGAATWRTKHLAPSPHLVESVDSTQVEARRLAAQGAAAGTIVVAGEQTEGRGRLGRTWASPKGNLYVTILLRPTLPLMEWPQVTMVASLAISSALDALGVHEVALKWPNDILIAERKTAGILAEVHASNMLLGFGVNVNAAVPPELSQATSIASEVGHPVERMSLLRIIVERFDADYDELLNGKRFTREWARRLATLGRAVQVAIAGRLVHGMALNVTDDGALVVRREDGVVEHFHAGDVTLRPMSEVEAGL